MSQLPSLPSSSTTHYSHKVQEVVRTLQDQYYSSSGLLASESFEKSRVRYHIETVIGESIPTLFILEDVMEEEHIPALWITTCTTMFCTLLNQLFEAERTVQGGDTFEVKIPELVTVERTGRPGRPKKKINPEFLCEAIGPGRNIYSNRLSKSLNVSRDVLRRELREMGVNRGFSDISDDKLDTIIKDFRDKHDSTSSGTNYVIGHVRSLGIRVQRKRVRDSIRRVNRLGKVVRASAKAKTARRSYRVSRPHALWHMDGHHKLIAWGIVIHGCVDGFSRTITGLRASNNNKASTVLQMFMKAVKEYGLPSRVRGDRGGENRNVAIFMILARGINRASYMWGSSTRNTRIERLWVEVGSQFARMWRAFFLRLEKLHLLDRNDPHHLWLLHFLFMDVINEDCEQFRRTWNAKPITGKGKGGNQSPDDMRLLGQVEYGVYVANGIEPPDDCAHLTPNEIDEYYGVEGEPHARLDHQTGAGHPEDEEMFVDEDNQSVGSDGMDQDSREDDSSMEVDESEWEDEDEEDRLDMEAVEYTELNIRHEPIPAARSEDPFTENEWNSFNAALKRFQQIDYIPPGYGVSIGEWPVDGYPDVQPIPYGTRGSRELRVVLPHGVWFARSKLWAQGLFLMKRVFQLRFQA